MVMWEMRQDGVCVCVCVCHRLSRAKAQCLWYPLVNILRVTWTVLLSVKPKLNKKNCGGVSTKLSFGQGKRSSELNTYYGEDKQSNGETSTT